MLDSNFDLNIFDTYTATPTVPAAGAEWNYSIPIRTRAQIVSVSYQIDTDANAGNRTLQLRWRDATGIFLVTSSWVNVPASVTRVMNFAIGLPAAIADSSGEGIRGPLPSHIFLPPGGLIESVTRGIQVGDTLTAIKLRIHRWIQH